MQPKKFRILSAITAGSLALAVAAIMASSGTGHMATHAALARSEASLRAARGLYYAAIEEAWESAQEQESVPVALRNGLRIAATHATRTSAEVVRSLYDLAGGPAIYDDAPLQRRFRDAHTATAHFQVNAASRELQGRLLLGQPGDTLML